MTTRAAGAFGLVVTACLAIALGGCAATKPAPNESPVEPRRRAARSSSDGEVVGGWLLSEIVSRGGDRAQADTARARLERLPHGGMLGSLARAVYDGLHGHTEKSALAYVDAVRAARSSTDPRAPLVAWFSTNHVLAMEPNTTGLWEKAHSSVNDAIARPGNIGWRARGELVTWATRQAWREAKSGVEDLAAGQHGCLGHIRIAGPFGHGAAADRRRVFGPEQPSPWQVRWAPDPGVHAAPHVLRTERHGCAVRSAEPARPGVYYAETFVDLPADREAIVAVQGAYRVAIDDSVVLDRDTRVWGVWTKFGVRVRLSAGRHRILARLAGSETAVRLLAVDGTPLGVDSSDDPAPLHVHDPPAVFRDANVLDRFVDGGRVLPVEDDVLRYVASYLAHVEEQDDVASVLVEPLVSEPAQATGPALAMAAVFAEKDPIFSDSDRHDLVRDLRMRAVGKDAELWWPRFWLALDQSEQKGLADSVGEVRKLADHFREVPEVLEGLADLYGRLSWRAERSGVLRALATRFPQNVRVLEQVLDVLEEEGEQVEADKIADRIRALSPDSEVAVDRALARRDYKAAIAELKRLGQRHTDSNEIADRLADVLARSGDAKDTIAVLERAVAKKPGDPSARLSLADARFAAGDRLALRKALADAILAGGDGSELESAVELIEGMTELEPYRKDGPALIRQYDASRAEMEGTAARVLDYAALWIHPDGSSRMLEHEIIRIQSQEAIGRMAEQKIPSGLLLHLRVIKKDGAILEPELVPGKATATMPHLEVGDCIETENITNQAGDGQLGQQYLGPHWFFREADVAYWRSELVVISPKDKPLVAERQGDAPQPEVEDHGPLVIRRWKVDKSPAAPQEPGSPPIPEFLPSVRVGWGISLADRLRRLADATTDELPKDPRLVRIAQRIAGAETRPIEQARRLYRWVLANVEEGRESDGRRVVVGKSGNRTSGFAYLCRTLGIPFEMAAVKDRLSPPALGPITTAESFDDFVVRLGGATAPTWLVVHDKHAPFGYLPANLRGQPAYRLVPGTPRETTSSGGSLDGVAYEGTGELRADGSAKLEISQKFLGMAAIGLRSGLEQLPQAQIHDVIEGKLLARAMPGARLAAITVENQSDLDKPIVLRMSIEVSDFARRRGKSLALLPPFPIRISQLASLPRRQTPLLIREPTYESIAISLRLPPGAHLTTPPLRTEIKDGDRRVVVDDKEGGGTFTLHRVIDIPAGRIAPAEYGALQSFARAADEATLRDVVIALP
jgi:cellulose synthase operon protein C